HGREAGRRLVEAARNRVTAAVANLAVDLDARRARRLQAVRNAPVNDAPAGVLDLAPKPIGGLPVPLGARGGAAVGRVLDRCRRNPGTDLAALHGPRLGE